MVIKINLLIGSAWDENLVLDKYNDNYFLFDDITVIAYIPTKAFSNTEDEEIFVNKLKNYLKK